MLYFQYSRWEGFDLNILLYVVMWVPFLVCIGICGFLFCRRGYETGVWHSVFSVCATVFASVMSIVLARLASLALGPLISSFSLMAGERGSVLYLLVSLFLPGIIQGAVALVLFFVFMLVSVPLLKKLAIKIGYRSMKDKMNAPEPENRKEKAIGAAVRLADSLLFTVMLLLPLYGTVNAYAPSLESVCRITGEEGAVLEAAESLSEHPAVWLSKPAPFTAAYDLLTDFQVNGETVSPRRIGNVIETTAEKALHIVDLIRTGEKVTEKTVLDLARYLEKNVVKADWAYAVSTEIIRLSAENVPEGQKESASYKYLLHPLSEGLCDMSRKEFVKSGEAVVDFAVYFIENAPGDLELESMDTEYMYENGMFAALAETFNETEQLRLFKLCLYREAAYNTLSHNDNAVEIFMGSYDESRLTFEKDLEKEGEALYIILSNMGDLTEAEALARHPYLGKDAFVRSCAYLDVEKLIGLYNVTAEQREYVLSSNKVKDALIDALGSFSDVSLEKSLFSDYCRVLGDLCAFRPFDPAGDGNGSAVQKNESIVNVKCEKGALSFALSALGEDYFALWDNSFSLRREVYELLVALSDNMQSEEELEGSYNSACDACSSLVQLMTKVCFGINMGEGEYTEGDWSDVFAADVSSCLKSDILAESLKELTQKGNDPFFVGAGLAQENKKWLRGLLDSVASSLSSEKATISMYIHNAQTGESELVEKPVSSLTDEELALFGMSREELESRYVPEKVLRERVGLLKAFFGL